MQISIFYKKNTNFDFLQKFQISIFYKNLKFKFFAKIENFDFFKIEILIFEFHFLAEHLKHTLY